MKFGILTNLMMLISNMKSNFINVQPVFGIIDPNIEKCYFLNENWHIDKFDDAEFKYQF